MSTLKKELIRQIIADGSLSSPGDIGNYLKDMFKDVIQEMLEQELALELGYEKGARQIKMILENKYMDYYNNYRCHVG